jgi:hypothetical protein
VFVGHYWLTGDIGLQSTRRACVDYSAGRGGPLVASDSMASMNWPYVGST